MSFNTARFKAAHTKRLEWQHAAVVWIHQHAVVYEAVAVAPRQPPAAGDPRVSLDWNLVITDGRYIYTEPRHVYATEDEALAARVAWAGEDEKRKALAARRPILLRGDARGRWERERRLAAWRLSHGAS